MVISGNLLSLKENKGTRDAKCFFVRFRTNSIFSLILTKLVNAEYALTQSVFSENVYR